MKTQAEFEKRQRSAGASCSVLLKTAEAAGA